MKNNKTLKIIIITLLFLIILAIVGVIYFNKMNDINDEKNIIYEISFFIWKEDWDCRKCCQL